MARGLRGIMVIVLAIAMVAQLAIFLYMLNKRADKSAPFSIELSPGDVVKGIVGEESVINVTVRDEGDGLYKGETVNLSGYAPGASLTIEPKSIPPGEVSEVKITPDKGREGKNLTVTIFGKRGCKGKSRVTVMVAAS
jgi:hypothetical protein